MLFGLASFSLVIASGASAQDVSLEIPLPTVVKASPGSEHVLASEDVPQDLVGRTCSIRAIAANQESVHPGNDLVISSNGDLLLLEDVEGEAFGESAREGQLTLGNELTVTLILGSDGVFSAGMVVEVRCPAPDTTTTTTKPSSTTTPETTIPTTSTVPDTTTTTTVAGTTTSTVSATTTSTEATTTTMGETTTSTIGDTTSTAPGATSTTPSTLPFTGGSDAAAGGLALVALATGMGLIALTRPTGSEPRHVGPNDLMIEGVRVRLLRRGD
ncbi:MAG: hypothetical protein ACRDVD_05205 [Acidimicrobiia bacterium]